MSQPEHATASMDPGTPWHALALERIGAELGVSLAGLADRDAQERLARFGANRLPTARPPSRSAILVRQFRSPLIYVLLAAAAVAVGLGHFSDAGFIAVVLAINAGIGFANEARAEQEVRALAGLVRTRARVRRSGRMLDLDGESVVPGDLLFVESGSKVCADLRLVEAHALRVDESLLTGESVPADKDAAQVLSEDAPLAERRNMAFAGSLVASGRGFGLVVATGAATEVGRIAGELEAIPREPPPLLRRMERFARVIGAATLGLTLVLVAVGALHGQSLDQLLLGAVALAVSAIPEGLPIALTVALAVAVSRMARRGVVVRSLPAVEALGSCGVIATDKTGTLTQNELTVEHVAAGGSSFEATGLGYAPEGEVLLAGKPVVVAEYPGLFRLLRAACLANEAEISQRAEGGWEWSGDPTDVALLSLGIKAGCDPGSLREDHGLLAALAFEPERRYAASFHRDDGDSGVLVCVKGAPERVIEMCDVELDDRGEGTRPLEPSGALASVEALMGQGYRVLAIADGTRSEPVPRGAPPPEPRALTLLGLVAMTDPPRAGVPDALASCRAAGVHVVMITGDHATTASAIASRIGLAGPHAAVLTGPQIANLDDDALRDQIADCRVVARATPTDKLRVVRAWQRRGALVAVTGDGVNDAPALRQADLGVAMGRAGTDVAREAADLVITDDDFSSIVSGIEEGRIAYENVRKVTYLLVSTGAGEVLLVTFALALGLAIPLTAVQLLWLNLVTNGIQDVALAFEPGEAGVLERPPRPPRERVFDRMMVERTLLAGAVFGGIGLAAWAWWLAEGRPIAEVRNLLVQLFVLFEIFQIGNARSERTSLFKRSPFLNPILFVGTLAAVGVHVVALYTPALQRLLGIAPLQLREWATLATMAASVVVVMEIHKWWRWRRPLESSRSWAT